MEFTGFTGVLTGVFAVVSILACAYAALQYGTVKIARETNNDLRAQHEDDKERLAGKTLENETLRKEKAELEGKVAVLTEINSGIVNWTAVTDQVSHHHERAEKHWARGEARWQRDDERQDSIAGLLTEIRDQLSRSDS